MIRILSIRKLLYRWRRAYAQRQLELKQSLEKKGAKKFKESKKQNKITLEPVGAVQEPEPPGEKKPSMISQKERAMWVAFLKHLQEQVRSIIFLYSIHYTSSSKCIKCNVNGDARKIKGTPGSSS